MIDLFQLAAEIAAAHAAVVAAESPALTHAKGCGELLIHAKKHVAHGGWLSFVKSCNMSTRTAAGYMSLARRWAEVEQISSGVANLSVREALARLPKIRSRRDALVPKALWKDLTWDVEREYRRITVEMIEFPFTTRTFNERPDASGCDIVAGCGGAPVFYDIVGGNPDDGPALNYTRGKVIAKLTAFLDGGPRSTISDLAVDVARRRIARDRTLSAPSLPADNTATVTLGPHALDQCAFLEQVFGTITLEETVAEAIAFAHFSYSTQIDDEAVAEERDALAQQLAALREQQEVVSHDAR